MTSLVNLTPEESEILKELKRVFNKYKNFNFFTLGTLLKQIENMEDIWTETLLNKDLIHILHKIKNMDSLQIRKLEEAFYNSYKPPKAPLGSLDDDF